MALDLIASFVIVFAVIGGTELVDRTNFALIGLAAKNRPLPVWAGAAAAFVVTTTIAVVIGAALLAALGGQVVYLRVGGGLFLLAYAGYLIVVPESERTAPAGRTAFTTAFLLILLLELGDTTMVFTIVFVSTMPNVLVVGVAAALALVCVAGSAALIGRHLGSRVEPKALERVVVVVLVVVGVLTILLALDPGILPVLPG
jgi:putative Ca2+/H+ antiporter (TMEM165/GDT1 family)